MAFALVLNLSKIALQLPKTQTLWHNCSAHDSRSEGCMLISRQDIVAFKVSSYFPGCHQFTVEILGYMLENALYQI